MTGSPLAPFRPRLLTGAILLGTLACYAWFTYAWGGFWNTNEYSRVFLTRALAERGSAAIDREVARHYTQDLSWRAGHFYSNKAPGVSVLAVPAYFLVRWGETGLGKAVAAPGLLYLLKLAVVSLPAVVFLGILLKAWAGMGIPLPLRAAGAVILSLGSPAFPYSTLLYGHYPAGILLFGAFLLLRGGKNGCEFLAGLAASSAVAVEYPALPAAALLLLYRLSRPRGGRGGVLFLLGAVLPLALLARYHQVCFGGAFQVPYLYEVHPPFFQAHSQGVAGVTLPSPEAVWGLTFSPFRGLFHYFPWTLAALPGLIWMGLSRDWRREGLLFLGISLSYFYITSAFSDWEGGWAMGPRHLAPLAPFWATALLLAAARVRARFRPLGAFVLAPLAVLALVRTFLGTAVFPYFPRAFRFPLEELVPGLLSRGLAAPSLGQICGLSRVGGLFPAAVIAAVLTGVMILSLGDYALLRRGGRLWLAAVSLGLALAVLMASQEWSRRDGEKVSPEQAALRAAELERVAAFMAPRPRAGTP